MKTLKYIFALCLILGLLGTGATLPSKRLYEVRVTSYIGHCTYVQIHTVEASSQREAHSKAVKAARSNLLVKVSGTRTR